MRERGIRVRELCVVGNTAAVGLGLGQRRDIVVVVVAVGRLEAGWRWCWMK